MVKKFQDSDRMAHGAFRAMLDAVSRPGSVYSLTGAGAAASGEEGLMLLLRTLLDHEVSHCVVSDDPRLAKKITEVTQSPCKALEDADFVVAPAGGTKGQVLRAKRGLPEYPDYSATVIYAVERILPKDQNISSVELSGPGIAGRQTFPQMAGFDYSELEALCHINSEFPLGVDAFFVDRQGLLVALPRSTRLNLEGVPWPM